MKRYRWFDAHWPISMRALANRLKLKAFEGEQTEGFVLDRVRDNFLEARFVEKIEYDDTVVDPFGKELTFHRVDFRKCEFRASVNGPGLELVDAPRGVQTMISRLAEASEFSLSISPLSVSVLAWAERLQSGFNAVGVVDSIQVGAVELSQGVLAKAVIRGSSDVLVAANKLVEGKRHIIEKVQLRLAGTKRTTVLLTNSGVARFDPEPSDELLLAVRGALPAKSAG